ncbi:ATP-binding protein [Paenibacillus sp. OAS669]|uniref:ATP-binding protein n=1 Tax=Paenibacillus sp. OAS669 TaxID=2663821 RepID=UPI00178BCA89|nr:ATP-binding protein [Paenibacillus sp. OAS669]MBE1446992.1 diguanylate cyclase (GGDEF)-like protein [Paenibacillus sp. OAS669]
MSYHWILIAYTAVICASSIGFDITDHPWLLIIAAIAYLAAHLAENKLKGSPILQMGLVMLFHWISQMDLILPLYIVQICKSMHSIKNPQFATPVTIIYTAGYVLIACMYMPFTSYRLFILLFCACSCLIVGYLFKRYLHVIENQTLQLDNEKKHLSTHDALTGLYNYEECHRQLEHLVQIHKSVALVLIDCKDLKSLNTINGFHGVNRILKQVAQLLRIMFPEALVISRYGGDEFAIVLDYSDTGHTQNNISQLMASEFPKLTGIEINYGMAFYPDDGASKDDLFFIAERNLYTMKRESWLKREEHMLRSEKLRVVGELASGMAHEIRNPLTTIKGFLQISKSDNYNIKPWYDLIMDEITRMSMLTAEFLQFSKPHATQFKVHSIKDCIQRVISLLDSETSRLGHHIDFESSSEPLMMLMDQDKMLQLLLNLIKNAFEAMPDEGLVRIRLTKDKDHAVIEISDTGQGIPEHELDQIFLPFYTTKESGTGLGLSICHKIVQDHEGTMEVESQIGKGTKFTITVPLSHPDASPQMSLSGNRSSM